MTCLLEQNCGSSEEIKRRNRLQMQLVLQNLLMQCMNGMKEYHEMK